MRNPYQVLGITSRSSKEEAKARYRKLCKTYHPDNLVSGDPIKFKEVQDAWKKQRKLLGGLIKQYLRLSGGR